MCDKLVIPMKLPIINSEEEQEEAFENQAVAIKDFMEKTGTKSITFGQYDYTNDKYLNVKDLSLLNYELGDDFKLGFDSLMNILIEKK